MMKTVIGLFLVLVLATCCLGKPSNSTRHQKAAEIVKKIRAEMKEFREHICEIHLHEHKPNRTEVLKRAKEELQKLADKVQKSDLPKHLKEHILSEIKNTTAKEFVRRIRKLVIMLRRHGFCDKEEGDFNVYIARLRMIIAEVKEFRDHVCNVDRHKVNKTVALRMAKAALRKLAEKIKHSRLPDQYKIPILRQLKNVTAAKFLHEVREFVHMLKQNGFCEDRRREEWDIYTMRVKKMVAEMKEFRDHVCNVDRHKVNRTVALRMAKAAIRKLSDKIMQSDLPRRVKLVYMRQLKNVKAAKFLHEVKKFVYMLKENGYCETEDWDTHTMRVKKMIAEMKEFRDHVCNVDHQNVSKAEALKMAKAALHKLINKIDQSDLPRKVKDVYIRNLKNVTAAKFLHKVKEFVRMLKDNGFCEEGGIRGHIRHRMIVRRIMARINAFREHVCKTDLSKVNKTKALDWARFTLRRMAHNVRTAHIPMRYKVHILRHIKNTTAEEFLDHVKKFVGWLKKHGVCKEDKEGQREFVRRMSEGIYAIRERVCRSDLHKVNRTEALKRSKLALEKISSGIEKSDLPKAIKNRMLSHIKGVTPEEFLEHMKRVITQLVEGGLCNEGDSSEEDKSKSKSESSEKSESEEEEEEYDGDDDDNDPDDGEDDDTNAPDDGEDDDENDPDDGEDKSGEADEKDDNDGSD